MLKKNALSQIKSAWFILCLASLITASCKSTSPFISKYYYDFEKKQLYNNNSMSNANVEATPVRSRAGKDIQIEIRKFNPLNIEIVAKDSSSRFFLTDSAKLSALIKLPTIGSLPVTAPTTAPATPIKNRESISKPTPCDLLNVEINDFEKSSKDVIKSIQAFKDLSKAIERINYCYDNLKTKSVLEKTVVTQELSQNFIIKVNSFLPAQLTLNADPNYVSASEIESLTVIFYNNFESLYSTMPNTEKKIQNLDIQKCAEKYKALVTSIVSFKSEIEEFKNSYANQYQDNLKKLLITYNRLKYYLNNDPSLNTGNIAIQDDEHIINVKSRPAGGSQFILSDKITFIPSRGFKLDISAGVFVSGLADHTFTKSSKDSILTSSYVAPGGSVRDTTTLQSFNAIYKQKQSPVSFGGSIYLNGHTQTGKAVDYGGFIGFGTLFNDQARLVMSIGPTLLITMKKQRLVINPGVAISQVDRLSAGYQTDLWYKKTIDNIPTFRAWKTSWILGISWNL